MVVRKTEIDVYRDGYGNTTHATVVIKPIYSRISLVMDGRPIGVVASGKIGPGSFSFQFQFVVPFYVLSSFLFENIPDKISSTYVSYKIKGRVVTGRSYVDYQDSVKVY